MYSSKALIFILLRGAQDRPSSWLEYGCFGFPLKERYRPERHPLLPETGGIDGEGTCRRYHISDIKDVCAAPAQDFRVELSYGEGTFADWQGYSGRNHKEYRDV